MAELTALKRQRGTCKARLTHLETYLAAYAASGDPIEILQTKIEFVQNTWSQFEVIQSQIEELDEQDDERETCESRYCQLIGQARAIVNRLQRPPVAYQNEVQNVAVQIVAAHNFAVPNVAAQNGLKVKLPTMNLPVFDGDPEKWLEFRDSFQGLIDGNRELSNIQRMYYLKSSVSGRAADVLQSLETSAENYQIAWNLLTKRFEDKRAIATRHLQLLLDIPAMQRESGTQLRQTLDAFLRHIRALELLRANTWDTVINHLMISKFDSATRREWRAHVKDKAEITVANLTEFLEDRCSIIEPEPSKPNVEKTQAKKKSGLRTKTNENSTAFASTSGESSSVKKCAFCGEESHAIYSCNKFKAMSLPQIQKAVNEHRLCRNCLRANHYAANCQSSGCKTCKSKHNTLLHPRDENENTSNLTAPIANARGSDSGNVTSVNCSSLGVQVSPKVILSTARVWIHDASGKSHECRVLLDSGSQSNFLTKELCERLKLSKQSLNCSVQSMTSALNVTEAASTVIQSKHTAYRAKVKFLIIDGIIDELPLSRVEVGHLQIPTNISLADEAFNVPGRIDALLGAGLFWGLLCIGQIKLGRQQPVLQKTHLGWIVSGNVASNDHQSTSFCGFSADTQLRQQVEKFWTIEEVDHKTPISKNDKWCEDHFLQTHSRDDQGRFTVSLPLKGHPSELGKSRQNALHRLHKLESKLEKDLEVKQAYADFMNEYIDLNHMTQIDGDHDDSSGAYFIPHHAVVGHVSDRIKLRVVFDASARTSSGKSLNDILRVGPTIQETLFSIVLRFRQHQYVITADIVKMYRQVNVKEEQRNLQRILWRSSKDEPVKEYQLNTVTYGLASAPFLAIRALHQAAYNVRETHADISQIIIRDFYVDDLLTGHDDLNELHTIKEKIATILRSSGFELAKWKSNETTLFERDINEDARTVNFGEEVKTLGLGWACGKDTLQYRVTFCNTNRRVTKRTVLSIVSQIFDPLGLVGPSTIRAKILIQKLWQLKLGWDESLPVELHTEWMSYLEELSTINDISIPRLIICRHPVKIELHGFCDASESAYGACVYLRSVDRIGDITIRLVCAKSKVAPLKTICIPRLELCGALLLAKLSDSVSRALTIQQYDRHYWCDSTIALAWIHSEPHLRKTFVANRVTEIQQLTSQDQWHHVRSEQNPAGVISRGISPKQLNELYLWWQGPEWLLHPEDHLQETIPVPTGEIPKTKIHTVVATQVVKTNELLERFSSWTKLKRVIAYCLHWKYRFKSTKDERARFLSVEKLERSARTIIRAVQAERFGREVRDLQNKQRVHHDSALITLHPFIDNDGLIRVGGRLRNAPVSESRRYPIVLPSNHHVTTLIIRDAHYRALHSGAQALLSNLQERFWILSAKSTIRKVLHKCIVCFRSRPVQARHRMGDLPDSRMSQGRAFLNVGIDYGGPFNLKLSKRTTCKAYICLFVCMSTKAIHLELVSDLSTAAFLNALKRFIARRGKCANIYSDNGSNFKGAARELRELHDLVTQKSHHGAVDRFCSGQAIQWHFIPPYSPHMGGLWEAGIKSVKTQLRRILGEALLTFEEMYTVLTQIEAVLNSRPLTPISGDPTDLKALTPGHFLIGSPLTAIPENKVTETPSNRLTRFQYLAKLSQQFWTRWSTEYLSNLQQRVKWNREDQASAIDVGQMVILYDDQTPSMRWALGRIVECHAGRDGQTRVVSIKTAKGVVKRAVAKICILPIESLKKSVCCAHAVEVKL